MQEPCKFPFVVTTHEPSTSTSTPTTTVTVVPPGVVGLGFAFALYTSSCSDACCDGIGLDWILLGSLAFQMVFFWTVARHEVGGFVRARLIEPAAAAVAGNTARDATAVGTIRSWLSWRSWLRSYWNWSWGWRIRGWNWGWLRLWNRPIANYKPGTIKFGKIHRIGRLGG
ncbi:hypothetical protein B0T24DRAFT_250283 [Lasiosphaeria ovina]|uniref:Uncharacterized protein n=1 Tax=Lasiosphaeria ovina TaxID=92902 RepID=A0AAE0KAZ6_9PEZI|nr:hypothetical protein B0T24DRAFT_250283 [Lasiosphaeria ovina]